MRFLRKFTWLKAKPGICTGALSDLNKYAYPQYCFVDEHYYYVCVTCGTESGRAKDPFLQAIAIAKGFSPGKGWPDSVPMNRSYCPHSTTSENIAKIDRVSFDGRYLLVHYERCKLCGAKFSTRAGNCCPACNRQLGCFYKDIGYASETVHYLFRRPALESE